MQLTKSYLHKFVSVGEANATEAHDPSARLTLVRRASTRTSCYSRPRCTHCGHSTALWVDLKGGHGGAEWKVYKTKGSHYELQGSADKYGDLMPGKYESEKLGTIKERDISWSGGGR